jgi:hypothetical protein
MGAVTEGFVRRVAAAAEADNRPASQAKGLSFRIKDLKLAFDADRSVVIDCDFRSGHFLS